MKDFIVVNEETGVIVDDNDFFIDMNGKLFNSYDGEISACLEKYKSRRCIGKTDIKGKNIYADSSIVEFSLFSRSNEDVFRGIVKYDNEVCAYYIEYFKVGKPLFINKVYFVESNIQDLKVVGNLQEKKDLL